jgi:hypothetical protein
LCWYAAAAADDDDNDDAKSFKLNRTKTQSGNFLSLKVKRNVHLTITETVVAGKTNEI